MTTREEDLKAFTDWCAHHITGDEKGEAQLFLDRLFQAFGHGGVKEAGATLEMRVAKDSGGTSFADLVWKPVCLIEMKKRGTPLQKHYRQAFDYWTRLVPNRPRYAVLCNFDEFRIYDFETQMDSPVDTVALADLPRRWDALRFLEPGNPRPVFDNDRVAVTSKAAQEMADVFRRILKRGIERPRAQRFILQMLVCFFAEDIGLLPKNLVSQLLYDCDKPSDSFDLLNGLFAAMNSKTPAPGGRFKDVRYFNGGLFAESAAVELTDTELVRLREISKFQWEKVQPEIFGTLFEASSSDDQRRAFGQHFTHPADIMKIVGPTISQPWNEAIDAAKTRKSLNLLLQRLHHFRVLDPACGSGNFLYLAYRELKRIEARILERIADFPSSSSDQMQIGFLSVQNFYGLDINSFAVEVAKVTMMIARKLAKDELHIQERDLPLDNLDANFITGDALLDASGNQTVWPTADVIIGNPPFVGSRYLAKSHGYDYARTLYAAYPDVPKMADYCVYWIRKAHDALPACTKDDPVAGRAGLVGTQSIRNNQSRVGGLDHVVKTGTIIEAVENQPWSGEANVHVSIANWVKTQDAALLPAKRKLWYKVQAGDTGIKNARNLGGTSSGNVVREGSDSYGVVREGTDWPAPSEGAAPISYGKKSRKRGTKAAKEFDIDFKETAFINSALSNAANVSTASVLNCNIDPKVVFQGQNPVHEGFIISPEEARQIIKQNPDHRAVIFPYLIGRDLVEACKPARWIIDFAQRDMLEAARFATAFARLQKLVMPDVLAKAEAEKTATGKETTRWTRMANRWWQFRDYQPGTMAAIAKLPRYIVCPRVTKRPTFAFLSHDIHPDGALAVFTFADDYSFGILQSNAHWQWFVAKCSKLKSDFRYTPESVFDTFAWPQWMETACPHAVSGDKRRAGGSPSPALAKIAAVAEAGREIRRIRTEALKTMKGGLRALYRTLELPGANPLKDAHAKLDAAVLAAYGFDPKGDLLAQLLALNQTVAARIAANEPVTAPGLPAFVTDPAPFITDDCIRP